MRMSRASTHAPGPRQPVMRAARQGSLTDGRCAKLSTRTQSTVIAPMAKGRGASQWRMATTRQLFVGLEFTLVSPASCRPRHRMTRS